MSENAKQLEQLLGRGYQHGFVTEIESDTVPPGLDEDVVRLISRKKQEPAFLTEWRLKALRHWLTMKEPHWAHLKVAPIDYQAISYYSAPRARRTARRASRRSIPSCSRPTRSSACRCTSARASPASRSMRYSTASRSRPRSRSAWRPRAWCSARSRKRCARTRELIEQYLGSVVPYSDNFFATLNSAVFSDGSFVYVPKGVRCPMELSTYFRINALNTGQFERTLIIADAGSYVSYLEGCTAPQRDENQLHAAVVELVALDDAYIKYSTVQNWYPGDADGRGGIYNFVTKRGECRGRNSHISWTQVETGSAITWKYPSCVLRGEGSIGEFYSVATVNNYQQADTGTKMIHIGTRHAQHHRLQGHLRRPRPEHLPRPGEDPAERARARAISPSATRC